MTGDFFADRLRIAIGGESLHAFSKRAGIADSTMRQYVEGSMPGLKNLIQIAETAEVTLDWLATGKGLMKHDPDFIWRSPDGQTYMGPAHIPPGDLTIVQRLEVQASAGGGALSYSEQAVDFIAFQSVWLRSLGVNPVFARIITSRGDSMEPTIRDGDVLLVDTSVTDVRDNGIYCVVYGNMLLVKRIHVRLNGTLQLISDNPVYPPEDVTKAEVEGLSIAGRVMWFGRSI